MINCLILEALHPSITDWIEAIGILLTFPTAGWGIVKLFRKDKVQERKISALEDIAKTQKEVVDKLQLQVEQLSRQTGEFQYQSSLMSEQNRIFEEQLELQISIFEHGKGVEAKKIDIEEKKRMSQIRPFFTSNGFGSANNTFHIDIINKGEAAQKLKVTDVTPNSITINHIPENTTINKGILYNIRGIFNHATYNRLTNFHQIPFEFNIQYEDIDGNKYQQHVHKIAIIGQLILDNPVFQK